MEDERQLINWRMLLRVIGWLLMIEAAFMCFPLITSLCYGCRDLEPFVTAALVTLIAGLLLNFGVRAHSSYMGKREGFLLTALTWVVFSAFGMLPFLWCDTPLTLSDSFFEAMSGFTTTGASILESYDHMSHAIHLWRCLMQWIGGMGIILFTLAIIPKLNHAGGMQMFNAEVTGITHDKIRPRISQTAKALWMIYIALTLICFGLLWLGPMNCFESICHSLSCLSSGGFSTSNDSIGGWDSFYVKIIITIFMFAAGVNFGLLFKACAGRPGLLTGNEVFRTYIGIIVVCYVVFVAAIVAGHEVSSWQTITIDPLFMIVSTITSTGYSVVNYETWGPFTLSIFFILMFFGACAGSTSGGTKIDRIIFLYKNCRNELVRAFQPSHIKSVIINNRIMTPELVNKAIAFLCIYVLLIVLGGTVLTAIGLPLVDAFFSAFSCIGNTGLGAGVTGYGESFEVIPDLGKWVLALLMLIGRLELYTVLVLFIPAFWHR